MEAPQLPLNERRYIVGYDPMVTDATRCIVFVVDKLSQRIVFKAINVKNRQTIYPSIKRNYDITNCIPPKQMKLALFE